MAKILTIDIETAPNVAYVWGCWKQNIGVSMMKENGYIMSVSAKWLNDDNVIYIENRHGDDFELVSKTLELLDEADIVIAHNAVKFDIPTILGRAAVHGIHPPAPFKVIDTLQSARKYFRFPMNSLAYLTKAFGVQEKTTHAKFPGFELWLQCLKQNDEAWAEMRQYNMDDVVVLEELYLRMRPWITNHPNVGVFDEQSSPVCPKCGSHHVHYRGYYHTTVSKYRRFKCQDCGGWGRSRFTEYPKDKRKTLLTNAV
jgi:DNA polymerase elongation subunit (family B)